MTISALLVATFDLLGWRSAAAGKGHVEQCCLVQVYQEMPADSTNFIVMPIALGLASYVFPVVGLTRAAQLSTKADNR
jgi:hypothetical protein